MEEEARSEASIDWRISSLPVDVDLFWNTLAKCTTKVFQSLMQWYENTASTVSQRMLD